jgi:hypothetical protein
MSLLDKIQSLATLQAESGITLTSSASQIVLVPGESFEFPTHDAAVPGLIEVKDIRFIEARARKQRLKDDSGDQLVTDTTFALRARVLVPGKAVGSDEQWAQHPIHVQWENRVLFLRGQQQGSTEAGQQYLAELCHLAGWVAPSDNRRRSDDEMKSKVVWWLQTRGSSIADQTMNSNGAFNVGSVNVRRSEYTREDGEVTGFHNFVDAATDNLERWLETRTLMGEEASDEDKRIADQSLTNLCGARTERVEAAENGGKAGWRTFPDRASIGEFSVVLGDERIVVSLWPSSVSEDGTYQASKADAAEKPF